jgi:hypothetical protein
LAATALPDDSMNGASTSTIESQFSQTSWARKVALPASAR